MAGDQGVGSIARGGPWTILATVNPAAPRILSTLVAALALAAAPFAAAQAGGPAPKAPAGFPPAAYAGLGSSMGQTGHFGEVGWTDEQFGAFIDGMRAAFAGKPVAMDDTAHQLSAEMARRIGELDTGAKSTARGDFPLSAYTAFGSSMGMGGHFGEVGWTEDQFEAFIGGMRSAFKGKPYEVDDSARQLAGELSKRISVLEAGSEPAVEPFSPDKLVPYMKDAVRRYHLQQSDTGLGYNISAGRNGIRPRLGDTVVISCNAMASDGKTQIPELSSDRVRSKLEQMFPGFREGLQMMTVGSHAILVLPPALTFGRGKWPEGVQPNSPLVFDVTLIDVVSAPAKAQD